MKLDDVNEAHWQWIIAEQWKDEKLAMWMLWRLAICTSVALHVAILAFAGVL